MGVTTRAVGYKVEVVGTKAAEAIKSEEEWVRYLRAAWKAIGESTVGHIQERINAIPFKKATGRLQRAVAWSATDYALLVYMDPNIAPYAAYQEFGVHEHVMFYLLFAKGPIPIPTGEKAGGKYPTVVFRTALMKWMGVPHQYTDQRGRTRWATGWIHPGYRGKRFFRSGVKDGLKEATEHLTGLVFKLTEDKQEAP